MSFIKKLRDSNSKLLDLPKELEILKEANGIQIENLKNEVTSFCNRVKKINNQIKNIEDFQLNNLKIFIEVRKRAQVYL